MTEREALIQAERALGEVVKYFQSHGLPPAGFPLATIIKPAYYDARRALGYE